jgi:hypothetical protein
MNFFSLNMVIRRLLNKFRKDQKQYDNRFVKFYHLNKKRLDRERKKLYHWKLKQGICVRCNKKADKGKIFCSYHRNLQKSYNKKARKK